MVEVHVSEPNLTKYLVEQFGLACEGPKEDALFLLPAHFLTILPEDGWDMPLAC